MGAVVGPQVRSDAIIVSAQCSPTCRNIAVFTDPDGNRIGLVSR